MGSVFGGAPPPALRWGVWARLLMHMGWLGTGDFLKRPELSFHLVQCCAVFPALRFVPGLNLGILFRWRLPPFGPPSKPCSLHPPSPPSSVTFGGLLYRFFRPEALHAARWTSTVLNAHPLAGRWLPPSLLPGLRSRT